MLYAWLKLASYQEFMAMDKRASSASTQCITLLIVTYAMQVTRENTIGMEAHRDQETVQRYDDHVALAAVWQIVAACAEW